MMGPDQQQTASAFSYKWRRTDSYASSDFHSFYRDWLYEKYFESDPLGPARLLPRTPRLRFLDAGCGAGLAALMLFGAELRYHDYVGVDVSDSVYLAQANLRRKGISGRFLQADILDLPSEVGEFDVIFSEGVLHHTSSVEAALEGLVDVLRPGGKILFYVYAKKAPIREFTDDFIRDKIRDLDDDSAWEALLPVTRLGKRLGELGVTVELDEDVPLLGLTKGHYDLQRLFFYKICKMFYRSDFSIEEMNHINFDWFRPLNCHRHTAEELKAMCSSLGLTVHRFHVEESGFSVIAEKL